MKFGKSLGQLIESSDPEWGPFWINYKYLKKKINEIVALRKVEKCKEISKIPSEIDFFKELKTELRRCSDFFSSLEQQYNGRFQRIVIGYNQLKENKAKHDQATFSRLLKACVNLYKDVLHLEHFAVTNYCGYSKILKKHDKLTGFSTRDAFMRNVMSIQNIAQYPSLLSLIKETEDLFGKIQSIYSADKNIYIPCKVEEEGQLFIDMIATLKNQAIEKKNELHKRKYDNISPDESEIEEDDDFKVRHGNNEDDDTKGKGRRRNNDKDNQSTHSDDTDDSMNHQHKSHYPFSSNASHNSHQSNLIEKTSVLENTE